MKVIGLTGGIASGKSTVKDFLEKKGFWVIDTDKLAHEALHRGSESYDIILEIFGKNVLRADNNIDRKKMAKIVFNNDAMKKKLEDVLHPQIQRHVFCLLEQARNEGKDCVFVDVPLLFEVAWQDLADEVWVVYVPLEIQIKRLMARDNFSREDALLRISKQMPLMDKCKIADKIIDNSGDLIYLEEQLQKLVKFYGRCNFEEKEEN